MWYPVHLVLVGGGKLSGRPVSYAVLDSKTAYPVEVFEPFLRDRKDSGSQLSSEEESLGRVRPVIEVRSGQTKVSFSKEGRETCRPANCKSFGLRYLGSLSIHEKPDKCSSSSCREAS